MAALVCRAENTGDFFQQAGFLSGVFVGALRADAERAGDFIAGADGDAKRSADAGLFRAGLGDAAGVGLEIAHGDWFTTFGRRAGDAFANGDCFYHVEHEGRQADLRSEVQQLFVRVEFVDGAGFRVEGGENQFQRFGEWGLAATLGLQQGFDLFR